MADPNQTPQRGNWVCPCNGCKKAAKQVVDQIIEDYMSCPNIMEHDEKVYCHTWWRHDDCERLMLLLNRITNNSKYALPEIKGEVKEAIHKMLSEPNMDYLMKKLGSDYDENGKPYWEQ